ncbi:hypothetical protein [Tuwongella immobilis]|uniref:Uncharacterized protein n=1 Tax=Tuwongella immobilis TaxID=692036 RepID=A0A6C2YT60_9BACT|nr:hypothetical protein [Tuwongella immobilis]VIP04571.1 unnamed protein product [Tuwongella immobilis]VTS06503.1 unnamed protein product [Tuwongella immobilis]
MSEQDLVNQLIAYLRLKRCFVWRQNQGGMRDRTNRFVRFCSQSGISDIIGMLPDGRFLAIQRAEPVAWCQRAGFDPAEGLLEEGMLACGGDRHAARER